MEVATRTVVPTAMSMGGSQSVTVKIAVPGRPEALEYHLGSSVTAGDLMNMLLEDLSVPRKHQKLHYQGKVVHENAVLASLTVPGEDLELHMLFKGLTGGGDEGCHCCGMHCMAYPECKMRICCFYHGCDLLFNKLQLFCCTWQWLPPECCEMACQCVTRICCCVTGCDTKLCQCQFYCCKCACCTDIDSD